MLKMKILKISMNAYLIVPALALIALTGCEHGGTNSNVRVSSDFLEEVLTELPIVEECCPATVSIIDDWIMQNAP